MLLRRLAAAVFVLVYLAYLACGTLFQLLGDVTAYPGPAYFVTWDMFPDHRSTSARVLVVGETEQGEFLQLYPGPRQRWREGSNGELTRLEFAPAPLTGTAGGWLEEEIAHAIEQHDAAWQDDPVRHVEVVREFWPARFNVRHPTEAVILEGDPPTGTRFREIVLSSPADEFRRSPMKGGAGEGEPR